MNDRVIDITGKTFGRLKVLNISGIDKRRETVWKCQCNCGNIKYVASSLLRDGRCKSCGCLKREMDLVPEIPHRTIDNIEYKRCSSCKKWKDLDSFHFAKGNWDKYSYECKACRKSRAEKNREKRLAYKKEYRKSHHDEIIKNGLKYATKRSKYDIGFRLKNVLASRIRMALIGKGIRKATKTIELVGCSIDYLKNHLESKFDSNMSWDNYGSYWHIDHIRPCASFDLSDLEQQKICFHYSNLQPLEAKENIRKGARV